MYDLATCICISLSVRILTRIEFKQPSQNLENEKPNKISNLRKFTQRKKMLEQYGYNILKLNAGNKGHRTFDKD